MGGVFSGNRRSRQQKMLTAMLPRATLSVASLYTLSGVKVVTVCPERDEWATVRMGQREWQVHISHTKLNFGGHRRWLVCPKCWGRRQSLFIHEEKLACRKCHDLRYASQSESSRTRAMRRADKLRAKLGWQPGVLSPDGVRPHGMHLRTYEALTAELGSLSSKLLMDLSEWLDQVEDVMDRCE